MKEKGPRARVEGLLPVLPSLDEEKSVPVEPKRNVGRVYSKVFSTDLPSTALHSGRHHLLEFETPECTIE